MAGNDFIFQRTNGERCNKKCKRTNCKFYNRTMDNNCEALSSLYKDAYTCNFYKKKGER